MSCLKDFFTAGLSMEEARDAKDKARADLRSAAAARCPSELSTYDAAEATLTATEKHFAEQMRGLAEEQRVSAHAFLHARGVDCGDPKCTVKIASESANKLN